MRKCVQSLRLKFVSWTQRQNEKTRAYWWATRLQSEWVYPCFLSQHNTTPKCLSRGAGFFNDNKQFQNFEQNKVRSGVDELFEQAFHKMIGLPNRFDFSRLHEKATDFGLMSDYSWRTKAAWLQRNIDSNFENSDVRNAKRQWALQHKIGRAKQDFQSQNPTSSPVPVGSTRTQVHCHFPTKWYAKVSGSRKCSRTRHPLIDVSLVTAYLARLRRSQIANKWYLVIWWLQHAALQTKDFVSNSNGFQQSRLIWQAFSQTRHKTRSCQWDTNCWDQPWF